MQTQFIEIVGPSKFWGLPVQLILIGFKFLVYDDDREWSMTKACGQRLCECDRALSMCLQKYSCPRDHAMCYSSPWRLFQNAIMG